jgi:hypothetical protein
MDLKASAWMNEWMDGWMDGWNSIWIRGGNWEYHKYWRGEGAAAQHLNKVSEEEKGGKPSGAGRPTHAVESRLERASSLTFPHFHCFSSSSVLTLQVSDQKREGKKTHFCTAAPLYLSSRVRTASFRLCDRTKRSDFLVPDYYYIYI